MCSSTAPRPVERSPIPLNPSRDSASSPTAISISASVGNGRSSASVSKPSRAARSAAIATSAAEGEPGSTTRAFNRSATPSPFVSETAPPNA